MKKQAPLPLRAVNTDRLAYERTLVRTACTGSNEDIRAVLARMQHRASLYSVNSVLPRKDSEAGDS